MTEYAIWLEPYGAVFIDIAKVASSSLKAAFAELLGLDLGAAGGDPHELDFPRPPVASLDGARLYPGSFAFAFVRNPWDRLVSCYRDKIAGEVDGFTRFGDRGVARCLARFDAFSAGMSFPAFVEAVVSISDADADEHFRSQHPYVTNTHGHVAVDFVGRYERLADDFRSIAHRLRLPADIELPRLQANRRAARYAPYYTDATRELVARRFAVDIDLFGYRFG